MFSLYFSVCALEICLAATYPYAQIILRNIGFSQSEIGVILALAQLASCIFPLLICNEADKRRKTKEFLILAGILGVLSHAVVFATTSKILIYASFILAYAFFGCLIPLDDGIISIQAEQKGGTYSTIRSTGSLSYVIILVLIAVVGYPNPAKNNQILLTMLVTGVLMVFSYVILEKPVIGKKHNKEKFFDSKWFDKSFYLLILIIFIDKIGSTIEEKFIGSYITEVLNLADKFTLFVALGAFSEFCFMIIAGKLLKKGVFNEWGLIVATCVGLIIRLNLFILSKNVVFLCLAQMLHCLTFGATQIAAISYIAKHVSKEHIALATTIYTSIAINLAIFIGSFFAGFIIDNLGYTALFRIYTVFPTIALILCFVFKKQIKK